MVKLRHILKDTFKTVKHRNKFNNWVHGNQAEKRDDTVINSRGCKQDLPRQIK